MWPIYAPNSPLNKSKPLDRAPELFLGLAGPGPPTPFVELGEWGWGGGVGGSLIGGWVFIIDFRSFSGFSSHQLRPGKRKAEHMSVIFFKKNKM